MQKRQREPPPAVPLHCADRAAFDSDDEYQQYIRQRRKAKERLREYSRPVRKRTGRPRPAREREKEQRRAIAMSVAVTVGWKSCPPGIL